MPAETATGGEGREFPRTRWTSILASTGDDALARQTFEDLARDYWKPLYHHVRQKGLSIEGAKDAVQDFFLRLSERDQVLGRLDPAKGSLRSYLKAALDNHVANLRDKDLAQKRGGGKVHLLDLDATLHAAAPDTQEQDYESEWALGVFERALARLRGEFDAGRRRGPIELALAHFSLVEPPSYAESAAAAGMSLGRFRAFLHRTRERYREILREEVARTVASDGQIDSELADLTRTLAR